MSTRRHTRIALVASTTVLTVATFVVACSDESSAPNLDLSDAGADAVSNLTDASADSGRVDAKVARDPFDPADEPVSCASTGPCAKQITAGRHHFCALMSDGTVRCWGADDYGALGAGEATPEAGAPTSAVSGLTHVTQISAGGATTCARKDDGALYCWGENSQGQLGLSDGEAVSDEDRHPTPERVALDESATRVDVGPRNVCAVLTTGKLSCWGNNEASQLARPGAPTEGVLGPALADVGALSIARTAIGTATLLGLTTGGELVSWGDVSGRDGLLGARPTSISPDPKAKTIARLQKVTGLAATQTRPGAEPRAHGCAIAEGEIYCWGRSHVGALGTGVPDAELSPAHAPIDGKAWPQQLAVGEDLTCARMTDGSIRCCGADESGRLGAPPPGPFSAFFAPIASFKGHAVQIAASDRAVCVLEKDGSVACWGGNASGELATGALDEDPHPSPLKVTF